VEVAAPTTVGGPSSRAPGDVAEDVARGIEGAGEVGVAARLEEVIDPLGEATGRAERSVELFTAVAEGRALDPGFLSGEIDGVLGLLERLDRDGEWEEALRLARAASNLIALARRWAALVRSVRIALRAAESLGDQSAAAWAWHQLGTFHLVAEDHRGADRALEEARAIRERLGDRAGLAATDHNLRVLCRRLRELVHESESGRGRQRFSQRLVVAAAAALLLVFALGVATGNLLGGGESQSERVTGDGGGAGDPAALEDADGEGGEGAPEAAELTPPGAFPETLVGTSSEPQSITARNPGQVAITLGSFGIGGAHPGDFLISSDACSGVTLPPGGECAVDVEFRPSQPGERTGTLGLSDDGTGGERTVALEGTGFLRPVD
jgi:hypothetical protein